MRESSGIAAGLVSLPTGGGGISPLGDRFQPDLVRGSGSYAVPLTLPKGLNELTPSLSLTYSTGSGNGQFGLGWRLNILRIERRTDRGIPSYKENDTFVIGDAEVLVHVGDDRYRPKTDTKFWHIKQNKEKKKWILHNGEGRTLIFGQTDSSREYDKSGIFSWYLDEEHDNAGNIIQYKYQKDKNRIYLKEVNWGIFNLIVIYENRPDILNEGRSGFQRLTTLRAKSIELHCNKLAPTIMKKYSLSYIQAANGSSLLVKISVSVEEDGDTQKFPDLSFDYAPFNLKNWKVYEPQAYIAPPSLDDNRTQLVDMTYNGLPDIIQSSGTQMFLWRNNGNNWFSGPIILKDIPSTVSLNKENVAFADLNGNGRVDLFTVDQPIQLAFETNGKGGFSPRPIIYQDNPNLNLSAKETKLMDCNGNGIVDLIYTGKNYFLIFQHEPRIGWKYPRSVKRIQDLEIFPDVTLGNRYVKVSDMNGDGLQDFVLLLSGNVCYWTYFGNCTWGKRRTMNNSPRFPQGFREEQVYLIDIDGDGCSDVVFIDFDRLLIWLNQSGSHFSDPIEIPISLSNGSSRVIPTDLYGDGRPGFLWNATSNCEYSTRYRFLRFEPNTTPYLLTTINNGMGGQVKMTYTTSTVMSLEDEAKNNVWNKTLPFSIPVVRTIEEHDLITNKVSKISIEYHDGVYDGLEREFRGFRNVTVLTTGDDSINSSLQKFTFYQGNPEEIDTVELQRQRSLSGALVKVKIFECKDNKQILTKSSKQIWNTRTEYSEGKDKNVFFPYISKIETYEYSATGSPTRIDNTKISDYDDYGNPRNRLRASYAEGEPSDKWICTEERYTYTDDEDNWIVKLPVRLELRDSNGIPFAVKITYYDNPSFIGMDEGKVERGLVTRVQELQLVESRLPENYIDGWNFSELGYELMGEGDILGYYTTSASYKRDSKGNIVEQKDPMGNVIKITYDEDNIYPKKSIDILNRETLFKFNIRAGEPVQIDFPDGRVIRYEYDLLGRLKACFETDDEGNEQLVKSWFLDLDSIPNSITSFAPSKAGRSLSEFSSNMDLSTLMDVSVSRVYYDGFGNETLQISNGPKSPTNTRRYVTASRSILNSKGLVSVRIPPTFVQNIDYFPALLPLVSTVQYRYDILGNLIETYGPGEIHHRVLRDTFSIQHFEGDGAGEFGETHTLGDPVRNESFDSRGRLISIKEFKNNDEHIKISYDLAVDGRIEKIRDDKDQIISQYIYAGPSEVLRIIHRDVGTRTYYRNTTGQNVGRINTDGSKHVQTLDQLGRLSKIEYIPTNNDSRELVREIFYDTDPTQPSTGRFLDGRISMVKELGNEMHYSYNHSSNIVKEEINIGGEILTVSRKYDLQGHLTAIIYPDNYQIEYKHDNSADLIAINGIMTNINYDADGAIINYKLANGVEVNLPRDPITQRLLKIKVLNGSNTLRQLSYFYDTVGNIKTIIDKIPGSIEHNKFNYDGLYRLKDFTTKEKDENGPLIRTGKYSYDSLGNLLQIEETDKFTLNYSDGVRFGRLTEVSSNNNSQTIAYDERGNITSYSALTSIDYDPLDRVSQIIKSDGTIIRFAYDQFSRRIYKEVSQGTETTKVYYVAGLYEKHKDHSIRHYYIHNQLIASEKIIDEAPNNPSRLFYASDHLGTILLATDDSGHIINNQRYTPFGSVLNNSDELARYIGRKLDEEIGLIQFGSRYYMPALGRFISPDWYVIENPHKVARIPQGFNLYSYSINNPLIFKDPSGLWFLIDDLTVLASGFVVGFATGLIYGLVNGQGWGSLLTALETGLTTAFGAWMGWNVAGAHGLVMGGMNGLISGVEGTYDWTSIGGWFSFIADSTWGLLGTSLGNLVHIVNLFWSDSKYRGDLSRRQNRHVYEGGVYLKDGMAFTLGNVISNAGGNVGLNPKTTAGKNRLKFVTEHEELHIWQSRFFGPLFQTVYISWAVGGFIAGSIIWFFNTDENYGSIIETTCYYDNPFEYWAYKNNNNWPPSGANKKYTW